MAHGTDPQFRTEHDSLGDVRVPADRLWGAQTQRSVENFRIGAEPMPLEIIRALAIIKKAAADANRECGVIPADKAKWIGEVCDEILAGTHDGEFPLVVWQTGSGTQTNMNVNEVIANRAAQRQEMPLGQRVPLHPNDDVNRSQSSNDVFPSAMRVAAALAVHTNTLPALRRLTRALSAKAETFREIVKLGRTHLMDATPVTLGQEFSGYSAQVTMAIEGLEHALHGLMELPLGGSAVGTGLNVPPGFTEYAIRGIAAATQLPFVPAANRYAHMAGHEPLAALSAAMKTAAIALNKIGNDIRLMGSGPRAGIGELLLPENEPGSSIMPGKVNPTQVEALTMVCAQVIGNDAAVTMGAASGILELNVHSPLIARNVLHSARLLGDVVESFRAHCVQGIAPNLPRIRHLLEQSLMLVTALNPVIGYDKAGQVARKAYTEGLTLRQATRALGFLSEADFERLVDPAKMVGSDK